jgi:alanine racemase
MSSHRAEVIVNLGAIDANIKKVIQDSGKQVLAVVKADAYGHGLVPVAQQALKSGATWLGTALLEEALTLRQAGLSAPIIAWLTPVTDDFAAALAHEIDLSIPSLGHLNAVVKSAEKLKRVPRVHFEVDTGMSRGGALSDWRALMHAAADLQSSKKIRIIGVWSHFARADEPGHSFNQAQLSNFEERMSEAEGYGIRPEIIHMSNSAATLANSSAHFDLLRLGIAMYGLSPDVSQMGSSAALGLQPAMQIRSRIHLVKEVPAGSQVGYGGTAITSRDTKLAVIPMGYADGIPRNTDSRAGVLIGNKRAPLIGRVSMDQFVVDVGIDSTAQAGDWAYIIGNENDGGYTADAWADASGTINYEIVTRIARRVPRIYI